MSYQCARVAKKHPGRVRYTKVSRTREVIVSCIGEATTQILWSRFVPLTIRKTLRCWSVPKEGQ